jgi:soluble lytic murein transglycosylase-like protein
MLALPVQSFAFCFDEAGVQYGINGYLLQNIAKVESNFNTLAVKVNGDGSSDMGLMQVNSFWISKLNLNKEELLSKPCYNVMAGAAILKYCIDRFGYTWEAVGCYNASDRIKRINYVWKVFDTMKRGGYGLMAQAESTVAGSSSLVFEARDKYDTDK